MVLGRHVMQLLALCRLALVVPVLAETICIVCGMYNLLQRFGNTVLVYECRNQLLGVRTCALQFQSC